MLTVFNRKLLCKCETIDIRNKVVSVLDNNNIHFQKQVKRKLFFSRVDYNANTGQFGVLHFIYVSKNDYEKAKNLIDEYKLQQS